MKMGVKKIVNFMLALVLLVSLAGCDTSGAKQSTKDNTSGVDTSSVVASKGNLPIIGTGKIKYDPNTVLNNGEPMTLEWWMWDSPDQFQKYADAYHELHPNIEIKVVNKAWEGFWTKLPLALKSGTGPALWNQLFLYENDVINEMDPYRFSIEDLSEDFMGINQYVRDGKIYWFSYGYMCNGIFYNKDMWKEAGLTETDIPKTWDEFREVAKKLTKWEGNRMVRAGFDFYGGPSATTHCDLIRTIAYQQGANAYDADNKPQYNSPEMKKALQMLNDFINVDKISSKDLSSKVEESFGNGLSAMAFEFGYYMNTLKTNYPEINYGVFRVPSMTNETPYAYGIYSAEGTPGINKNLNEAEKDVAHDFVNFYIASSEIQVQLCSHYGLFPSNKHIVDDPIIQSNPLVNALEPYINRYVFAGAEPQASKDVLTQAYQEVVFNGKPVDTALETANEDLMRALETYKFTSLEPLYEHASEAKR